MIFDRLSNATNYYGVATLIEKGFGFLNRSDLALLEDGVHEVQGREVFAIIARGNGVGRERAMLEAHREYLDIQYVIDGTDTIGWLERDFVQRVKNPYDREKDLEFFFDRPESWVQVPAGSFAIFLPQDIHAPLATTQYAHKAVVKVKLQ
ncbi:MAG: YhcH/YjgK/YiaL family protein [Planctomycetaceae bacterium]|nr:YhcH/YjgK/YiaL family protein [Planctomycetaceae bacterium]|tara:strand:+ start:5692 stop:6141 length:450 start_codon:yes stop_codon:yes gene_type:complete